MLSSLQIVVLDIFPEDNYVLPDSSVLDFDDRVDSGTRVITYNGTAPIQVYMDLLNSIEFSNELDEPRIDVRRLTVQVFAPGELPESSVESNIAQVTINVVPLNDNDPLFSQVVYNGSVVENSPNGTVTGVIVVAMDGDTYGQTSITYEIMHPDFRINQDNGVILTNRVLDAESSPSYSFTVVAMDNDVPVSRNSMATVNIEVIDLNDNSPVFNQSSYTTSVSESATVQSVIFQVTAQDLDVSPINSDIRYEILPLEQQGSGESINPLPDSPSNASTEFPFVINPITGEISLSEMLDYEIVQQFMFTVLASDGGSLSRTGTTQVTVVVEDANDNAPQFVNAPFSVILSESEQAPAVVMSLSALDGDSGTNGEIEYSLVGTEQFSIDATTGLLSLVQSLDYERQQSLNFTVIAMDSGTPPLLSEEQVFVTILNVNDNAPQFSEDAYVFNISENTVLNVGVFAIDQDLDEITYLPFSGFSTSLELDPITGAITNTQGFSLDYEMQQQFKLVVRATDRVFNSDVNVTINVLDENDNEPMFESTFYRAIVNESLPIGTTVLQVRAEDGDTGSNAEIEYTLDPLEDSIPFSVNSQTGEIVTTASLDFDSLTVSGYTFIVIARNTVPPHFNDTTMVTIELTDTNDIRPMLILDQPNVTFVENSDAQRIASGIVVTDADGAEHALTMCMVVLDQELCESPGIDICRESIAVNETGLTQLGLNVETFYEVENLTIVLTGRASELVYQQVLASLEYTNTAQEPNPGVRSIEVQCSDGDFASNILQILVDVELINEFCPAVSASRTSFNYTEESGILEIGSQAGFELSDRDRAPHDTLKQLQISLTNRLDGEYESISVAAVPGVDLSSTGDAGSGEEAVVSDTVSITASGSVRLSSYQQLLRTLVYENNRTEPTPGLRQIEIHPIDSAGGCSPLTLSVSISLINDNPPILVLLTANAVSYVEGSGDVAFASGAGLTISDADHNQFFPLQSSSVILDGVLDHGMEMLGYESASIPSGVSVTSSISTSQIRLQLDGRATVQDYEAALLSLTYSNNASEPTPGNRTVRITVSDGIQQDVTVVIVIVFLVDDNPLSIQAAAPQLLFTEGDVSLPIGTLSGVVLMDADRDPIVENLTVTLTGIRDQGSELLSIDASIVTDEEVPLGSAITISRRNSLANYQVRSHC